jgi:cobalamin biosynthesis protein CobD/CbiB
VSDRVGYSADRIFRPFLPARAWLLITVALFLATAILGLVVGAESSGPALLGFLFAAWMLWRSTYNWRAWNEAVAAQRAKDARAAEDERARQLYREWLRRQLEDDA